MQPILWFVLGLVVAVSGQAVAESLIQYPSGPVDAYGGSLPGETYAPVPGGSQYRDSRGGLHYYAPSSQQKPC